MEHINSKQLRNISLIKYSRESIIYKCNFKNKRYVLKKFKDSSITDVSSFDSRFDFLRSLSLKNSVIPQYITEFDSTVNGYLTELALVSNIDNIINPITVYRALIEIKDAIVELHNNGVIHGDIHSGNVVIRKDRYNLIDFDNFENASQNIHLNPNNTLLFVRDFIKKNGINFDVDIFMFNVLTFKLISGADFWNWNPNTPVNFYTVKHCISINDYGLFNSQDSMSICNAILTDSPSDYLIDTVNEDDIKRYTLNRIK